MTTEHTQLLDFLASEGYVLEVTAQENAIDVLSYARSNFEGQVFYRRKTMVYTFDVSRCWNPGQEVDPLREVTVTASRMSDGQVFWTGTVEIDSNFRVVDLVRMAREDYHDAWEAARRERALARAVANDEAPTGELAPAPVDVENLPELEISFVRG